MKKKILLLETLADEAYHILADAEDIEILPIYEMIISEIEFAEIDAVITRGIGKVNIELLDKCPKLFVAARCGVGLDNVDVASATLRNIKVLNAPGSNAATVAEHTIALMLMLERNLYQAINDVKAGNWAARATFKSDELGQKTLGIIGLGNIGLKVAKIAEALGMKIQYWSQTKKEVTYEFVDLETLYKTSDVISLHIALKENTQNLINSDAFSLFKPETILINTARAQLVDKESLVKALNSSQLAAYGADVPMNPAPAVDDSLISHPKALITAHVSSLSSTTYKNMCVSTVNNVLAILRNQEPDCNCIFNLNELNK
jgi:D-3-phosphoglycerate dehydrogenase / 2-oxoglutarate reductase